MILDDVKKKISFTDVSQRDYWSCLKRRASIHIAAEASLSSHGHPPMKEIDERLTYEILRQLYADRRREIQEKLFELKCFNPFDGFGYRDKIDELEKLLAYGPPV